MKWSEGGLLSNTLPLLLNL